MRVDSRFIPDSHMGLVEAFTGEEHATGYH